MGWPPRGLGLLGVCSSSKILPGWKPTTLGPGGGLCGLCAGVFEILGRLKDFLCTAWEGIVTWTFAWEVSQGPDGGWAFLSLRGCFLSLFLFLLLSMPFSVRAKYAVSSIKKKVNDKNPHVALYALEVIRPCTPGGTGGDSRDGRTARSGGTGAVGQGWEQCLSYSTLG